MRGRVQNVLEFAAEPESGRLFKQEEALDRLFDGFAEGGGAQAHKEEVMADGMDAVANALERMSDKLDEIISGGGGKRGRKRDRDDDAPESARDMRGRNGRGEGEIQGVLFPVSIPLGRGGDTLSCYLLTGPVRDERDLLDLAEEVDRGEFRRVLRVYKPKQYDNRGYGGNGGGYNRSGNGGYDRDRGGYDRDRR